MRLVRSFAAARQVIRAKDFRPIGLSTGWLELLPEPGFWVLERRGPGLYVLPGTTVDPLVLVARKYPRLRVGLMSALWLSGVGERPAQDWWIIGKHARVPGWDADGRARYVRSTAPERECQTVAFGGADLGCHTPTRAAVDCVRHRRLLGEPAVVAVLRNGLERGIFTVEQLLEYAQLSRALAGVRAVLTQIGGFSVRR
jgi:hypothetical protein